MGIKPQSPGGGQTLRQLWRYCDSANVLNNIGASPNYQRRGNFSFAQHHGALRKEQVEVPCTLTLLWEAERLAQQLKHFP